MNGVAEQLLQDLLNQAQAQTALLQQLARSYTGGGGGGVGGGAAGAASALASLTPVGRAATIALGALNGAVNLVSNVLSGMSKFIGFTVQHFKILGNNIIDFTKKAAEGTAQLSDLFKVFGQLPFFIGSIANIFSNIISVSEGLLGTYREITKTGASFSGNLFEMASAAARAYLPLKDFTDIISKNSDIFAALGGTVDEGFRKFTSIQNALMGPSSEYRKNILGLGYTIKDAADYTALFMRMTSASANGRRLSDQEAAKSVSELIIQVDAYSKLTGQNATQLKEQLEAQARDENLKRYLSGLGEKEQTAANFALAQAKLEGGQGLYDMVAQTIMTNGQVTTAFSKASQDLMIQTGGFAIENARARALLALQGDMSIESAEEVRNALAQQVRRTQEIFGGPGVTGFLTQIGALSASMELNRLANNAQTTTSIDVIAAQRKQYESLAARLADAQLSIQIFGQKMMLAFYKITGPLTEPILAFGESIIKIIDTFTGSDGFKNAIKSITDVIKDSLEWFNTTLTEFSKVKPEEFWPAVGKKLGEAAKNIGDFLKPIWDGVKPTIITAFNDLVKFLQPYFQNALDKIMETLRDALHEQFPRIFDASENYYKNKAANPAVVAYRRDLESGPRDSARAMTDYSTPEGMKFLVENFETLTDEQKSDFQQKAIRANSGRSAGVTSFNQRHSGTLGMTGSWWEKSDALLNVKAGESVVTPEQMAQLVSGGQENLIRSISQLNNMTAQMLKAMNQTAEYTKRNYDAIKAIDGNQFATV